MLESEQRASERAVRQAVRDAAGEAVAFINHALRHWTAHTGYPSPHFEVSFTAQQTSLRAFEGAPKIGEDGAVSMSEKDLEQLRKWKIDGR